MGEKQSMEVEIRGTEASTEPNGERLNPVFDNWKQFAAFAWDSYQTHGRGVLLITIEEGGGKYDYHVGTICDCHEDWVREYDPEQEVIVFVRRAEDECGEIYRLSGWPSPLEAFEMYPDDDARTVN